MTAAADKRPRHLCEMYLMRWGETGGLVLAVSAINSVVCPRVPASAVELVTAPNLHLMAAVFRDSGTAGTADLRVFSAVSAPESETPRGR